MRVKVYFYKSSDVNIYWNKKVKEITGSNPKCQKLKATTTANKASWKAKRQRLTIDFLYSIPQSLIFSPQATVVSLHICPSLTGLQLRTFTRDVGLQQTTRGWCQHHLTQVHLLKTLWSHDLCGNVTVVVTRQTLRGQVRPYSWSNIRVLMIFDLGHLFFCCIWVFSCGYFFFLYSLNSFRFFFFLRHSSSSEGQEKVCYHI